MTIGPNAIVAAGSVVACDVAEGTVVAGVPAKVVGSFDDLAARLEVRTREFPWWPIIATREGDFDSELEPELNRLRVEHFFGPQAVAVANPATEHQAG